MTLRAAFRATTVLVSAAMLAVMPAGAQTVQPPRSALFRVNPGATATLAPIEMQDGTGQWVPIGSINPTTHAFAPQGLPQEIARAQGAEATNAAAAAAALQPSAIGTTVAGYNDPRITGALQAAGGNGSAVNVTPTGSSTPQTLAALAALAAGAVPSSQLGLAPGQVPLLGNYQGTGNAGWAIPQGGRIVFWTTPTATDYTGVQIVRSTSYTGGSGNIAHALTTQCTIGSADQSSEWCSLDVLTDNGTAGGNGVARYIQANRLASGGSDAIWSLITDTRDQTDLKSSMSGKAVVGYEHDFRVNQADDAVNANSLGGVGVRKPINLVFSRFNTSDTTPAEVSDLFWVTQTTTNGAYDPYAYADSVIGFGLNTQIRVGLDTRNAIAPTGATNPLLAVDMVAGQGIDFAGAASRTAAPGRPLLYNATDAALEYTSPGGVFKIGDDGGFQVPGSYISLGGVKSGLAGGVAILGPDGFLPIANARPPYGTGFTFFTASGSFTVPAGVTRVRAILQGGGGAGGSCAAATASGAGGQPGVQETIELSVTPGASMSYTVGALGVAAAAGSNAGGAGGDTTFGGVTARGGNGGSGSTSGLAAPYTIGTTSGRLPAVAAPTSLASPVIIGASFELNSGSSTSGTGGNGIPSPWSSTVAGANGAAGGNASGYGGGGAGAGCTGTALAGGNGSPGAIALYY